MLSPPFYKLNTDLAIISTKIIKVKNATISAVITEEKEYVDITVDFKLSNKDTLISYFFISVGGSIATHKVLFCNFITSSQLRVYSSITQNITVKYSVMYVTN